MNPEYFMGYLPESGPILPLPLPASQGKSLGSGLYFSLHAILRSAHCDWQTLCSFFEAAHLEMC